MADQAEKLRELVQQNKEKKEEGNIKTDIIRSNHEKKAKVISITSGKGGVGKTNISVNLAIALKEQGFSVVLIDADLGLSNVEVMFNIHPKHTLLDVIKGDIKIEDALEEGPNEIKFLSGGSGVEEIVNLSDEKISSAIENLAKLDEIADYVIVDTSAGINKTVINFLIASDEIILITTPEPTAITDAYGMLKVLSTKKIERPINVLINQVDNSKQAMDLLNRFATLIYSFLSVRINPMGYIEYDKFLQKSVMIQLPVLLSFRNAISSKQIKQISCQISENDDYLHKKGIKEFFKKILKK